ncbi:MAG: phosphotransferase [Actinomycetota bacterium]
MSEVEVRPTPALVRRLLAEQLPGPLRHLGAEPVRRAAQGRDNAVFRLGDSHAVRLPLRRAAVPCLRRELRWTARASAPLAALGLDAPRPLFAGRPGAGYPWPWAVLPWIEGEAVALLPVPRRDRLAADLARALAALHVPAPSEAPRNPFRGVPLVDRLDAVPPRWPAVADVLGPGRAEHLRSAVDDGLAAVPWDRPPVWLHGDPHPWNLVHRRGRLAGLIDYGDVCAGDPASDLAAGWLTLDPSQRAVFRGVLDAGGTHDDDAWRRARAWAALLVSALVADQHSSRRFGAVVQHAATQLESSPHL